jgi:integrase
MKLTAANIERMAATESRREVPDSILPGLYLVVQPSGAKSFAVRYRHHGHTRKLTLGAYPKLTLATARELARDAFKTIAKGKDPASERRPEADTIAELVAQFLKSHVARNNRPRTAEETERIFNLHVLPKWRNRLASDITRRDVIELLDGIVEESPIAANRTLAAVRKLFNWAIERDILSASPIAGVKPPAKENARDRVLSDQELAAIYRAASEIGWPFGPFIQMLALTGQRRNEVAGMQWSELDLKARVWTIPKERAKNAEGHTVPLSPQAVAIIEGLPRIAGSHYVFTTTGTSCISGFSKGKAELDAIVKLPAWRLHDLRRTVATGMARLGVDLPVIEKVLNHSSGSFAGIVGVYQKHKFETEKRAALVAWAAHVVGLKRIKIAA